MMSKKKPDEVLIRAGNWELIITDYRIDYEWANDSPIAVPRYGFKHVHGKIGYGVTRMGWSKDARQLRCSKCYTHVPATMCGFVKMLEWER